MKKRMIKKLSLINYISPAQVVVLILFGLIMLNSCGEGVNIGEANKVLTSFSIEWPEGFDGTLISDEPVDVIIKALDQDGNEFNWSGSINIIATSSDIIIKPSTVDVKDGKANITLRISNDTDDSIETYIKVLSDEVVIQIAMLITVEVATPEIVVRNRNVLISNGDMYDGGSAVLGYYKDIVFTIENKGNVDLQLTNTPAVIINGDSEFTIENQPSGIIEKGKSVDFIVRFVPSDLEEYSTTLTIASSDPENGVYIISLKGHGIKHDIIVKNETTIINPDDDCDIGSTNEGEAGEPVVFTVENVSTETIDLYDVSLVSGNVDQFILDTSTTDFSLSSGEETTFFMTFSPETRGEKSCEVSIGSSSVEGKYNFTVRGTGTYPEIAVRQDDVELPSGVGEYGFGGLFADESSKTTTFTIFNEGTGELRINDVQLAGGNIDQFTLDTSNLDGVLGGGENATFNVIFSPISVGEKCAVVNIITNDSAQKNYTFEVKGAGNWKKSLEYSFEVSVSVAVDSNNNLYVIGYDYDNGSLMSIRKFDEYCNEDTENWNKKIPGFLGISIAVDSNDNVYAIGINSDRKYVVKKFNSNGVEDTENWNIEINYVLPDHPSFYLSRGIKVASIAVDNDDNVYIGGYYMVSEEGDIDWWVKKFDSNGNEDIDHWNKVFSCNYVYQNYLQSIAIDSNNNVYIVGNLGVWGHIKKFDKDGNLKWEEDVMPSGTSAVTRGITIDSCDNIYVVGVTNDVYGNDENYSYLRSFTSSGDWRMKWDWCSYYSDADFPFKGEAFSVVKDSDDNIYVVGAIYNFFDENSGKDWWIRKFDSMGDYYEISDYDKRFQFVDYEDEYAFSAAMDQNNHLWVNGFLSCGDYSVYDPILTKFFE